MKAPADAQLRLLDLQAVDTAIAQLQRRRRTLPEIEALAAAQERRGRLSEQIVAKGTQVSDLELDQQKAEADLVPVRERRVRNQKRLDDGSVTDPKQLNSLIDEIAHLGKRISDLEDAELEVMDALETAQGEHAQLVAERAALENDMRKLIAARDEQAKEIDADLAVHEHQRAKVAEAIPSDLKDLYDRLRAKLGGIGVGALQARRCGGCQLGLTQSALATIASAPADEVVRCEECDRILVRTLHSGI